MEGLRSLLRSVQQNRERIGSVVIAASGLLAASIALTLATSWLDPARVSKSPQQIEQEIVILRDTLENLKADTYSEGEPVAPMDSMRVQVIEEKISLIERAMGNNIDRALAVPLMRKDLDQLASAFEKRISSVENNIDRIYGLMIWLIGIVVTISLAAGGILISRRKSD